MRKIFLLLMAILLLIASASFAEGTEVFKVDHENEAVAAIRARLVARDPDFILALPGSGYSVDTIASFMLSAVEHTGVSDEGDYLHHHLEAIRLPEITEGILEEETVTLLRYQPDYKTTAEQEDEVRIAVEDFFATYPVKEIESEYERAYAIYDYVCDSVLYDYARLEAEEALTAAGQPVPMEIKRSHTAYAAFVEKTAVCEGYALAFYRLALEAGLDARLMYGTAYEDHTWVMVRIDGQYYLADPTWDSGNDPYEYFLVASLPDHEAKEDLSAAYALAEQDYFPPEQVYYQENGYTYTRTYGASIIRYEGQEADVVFPETLGGLPVVSAKGWGLDLWYAKSLTLPEGFRRFTALLLNSGYEIEFLRLPSTLALAEDDYTNILGPVKAVTVSENNPYLRMENGILYSRNMRTLLYCAPGYAEQELIVPEGVKRIGPSAFRGNTAVRKVMLPDSIRVIDSFAFNGTQLEEINLPEGCTAIGMQAFQYTSLRHITIPSSVTEIGGAVFAGCSQLESVDMPVGNGSYFTREGVLYNIPYEGALQILAYPAGRAGREYVLPAEVCYVAGGAFNGSKLEHVELPDDLVLLASEAFRGCTELKEIVIPASVRSIWEAAFMECSSLEKITLLGDPEEIIESAFGDPAARPGSPVICCKEGTFAMEFAQQYGFATEVLR